MLRFIRKFLVIVVMAAILPCAGTTLAAANVKDELVELAKKGGKPVIADFGLGFCIQCRKQAKILEEIRNAYGDKVVLRMVNVGKEQALTSRYGVESIPTLVFFDAEGNVVLKKLGPMGYDEIRKQLARMGVK